MEVEIADCLRQNVFGITDFLEKACKLVNESLPTTSTPTKSDTTTTSPATSTERTGGLPGGAIAGIVPGAVVVAVILVVVYMYRRTLKKKWQAISNNFRVLFRKLGRS